MSPLDAVHAAGHIDVLGAAIARAHRVDEDQVGLIQPGILVVFHLIWRLEHAAVWCQLGTPRAHAAQMDPERCRSRAPIKAEGEWTPRRIFGAVQCVRHVKDMGFGFAGRVLQRHLGDRSRVVQRLSAHVDGVFGNDRSFIDFATHGGRRSGNTTAASAAARRRRSLVRRRSRGRLSPLRG